MTIRTQSTDTPNSQVNLTDKDQIKRASLPTRQIWQQAIADLAIHQPKNIQEEIFIETDQKIGRKKLTC